jgi:GntR family transcriptional regulator, transcriptional repressor for pyruvate dehydrogenase complex
MKTTLDERDLLVLECIRAAGEPLGSWSLVEAMEQRGSKVSSASIGRILYRLEALGYVESRANKGRVLSKNGLKAMEKAKAYKSIDRHRKDLERLIDSRILDDFIMVLQARKAIERETVRMAAENITESKLLHLESIIREQEDKASRGESIADVDIAFHREIAEASTNSALLALYGILAMMGQQSELFEFMRHRVGVNYRTAHRSILESLKRHDADEAERCIIGHMDGLIEDVKKYWEHYRE